jgi:2-methylcitrate dehydratase PrpD
MDQNLKTDAVTLTKTLCGHLAAARYSDLSENAKHEAKRGVLDWIGCALAGSGHRTITTLLGVLQETSGKAAATVLGRKLKLGLLDAPLANGQMGHVLDYDDTHMGGVVLHTSSPVLAALLALAERNAVGGEQFMLAYAVGFEAGVRSGRTAPGHHKGGWHLTGTLGSIAAGVAAGKLIGLDAQKLTYAMGLRRRRPAACSRTAARCASRCTPARPPRTACWRRCWPSAASTRPRRSSKASAASRASTATSPSRKR